MPKNQKLGAMEQAMLDIAEYNKSPMKAAILARQKAGERRVAESHAQMRKELREYKALMKNRGGTFKGTF